MMVYQGISQPIRAFRRAMSACGARVELDDRPCECLTGREDVAAGVGVVAGASGDEDAVGEGNGLSGGCQEEGDQKGRDGEKNPAGKTHGKPPYYSFLVRAAYSNAVKGSERRDDVGRPRSPIKTGEDCLLNLESIHQGDDIDRHHRLLAIAH